MTIIYVDCISVLDFVRFPTHYTQERQNAAQVEVELIGSTDWHSGLYVGIDVGNTLFAASAKITNLILDGGETLAILPVERG